MESQSTAITLSLDTIVAGDLSQCETLCRLLEGNNQIAIITAIKNDNGQTAYKVVQALSKIGNPSVDDEHRRSMLSVCQRICKAGAECTDILLDHGLVQAMQLLLEHIVLVSPDQALRNLVLALIHTVITDFANGFKRSGRIMASKRFCSLLGTAIRNECRQGELNVYRIASLLESGFRALAATDMQGAEELDRKLGNILTWLVEHYAATADNATLAFLLVQIIVGHEYVTAKVIQSGAIQQVVEQAQGLSLSALGAMWNGSDGVPGARHLVQYCDVVIEIMHSSEIGSKCVIYCVHTLSNLTRCKLESTAGQSPESTLIVPMFRLDGCS